MYADGTETLVQSETESVIQGGTKIVVQSVVPKQQPTWSDSFSLRKICPPAVPAQEPILVPAMEQQQPESHPEMELAEAEEQLTADPPGGDQEEVPQLRRYTRVRLH